MTNATWQSHYQVSSRRSRRLAVPLVRKAPNGKRIYRKRVIGTIEEYSNEDAARSAVASLITEVNRANLRSTSITMTVAQLCSHFEQRELARSNTWRSYSTKMCYAAYLRRWILPNWGRLELRDVRTIEFESWLRRLPLAKGSCAKIRGVMSVLFNHACRYEFFDRNPIRLVRQGAKRKAAPNILTATFGWRQSAPPWNRSSRSRRPVPQPMPKNRNQLTADRVRGIHIEHRLMKMGTK
jgi:hypothetical protein